jgi:hypothetical protein
MPSDVLDYKPKMLGNFTTRQLFCGSLAVVAGMITFFLCPDTMQINTRIVITVLPMLPFLIFGWMTLYGQPLEKIGRAVLEDNFLAPAIRRKETPQDGFENMISRKAGRDEKPAAKSKQYKEIR